MKRVLFVTYDFPYPTNTGGKNRAYHMLKYSGDTFEKYLFSFVRDDFQDSYINEMEKIGVKVAGTVLRRKVRDLRNVLGLLGKGSIFKSLYFSREIAADLWKIIEDNKIDVVHFESFYTGFYISDKIHAHGIKQVYGSENIESKLYRDYAKGKVFGGFLNALQVKRIEREEIAMYKNADMTIGVTDQELEFVKQYARKAAKVPNGVNIDDFTYHKPANKNAANLLFVGNFTYFPNIEAINTFYESVFKDLGPEIKLTIIGKKVLSLPFVRDLRIEATEFIPDISDAYKKADILISPISVGGGTNFKILEAMAAGVPVVALKGRMDALGAEDQNHVMIARDIQDFKDKITLLLSDLALRQKLSKSARKFVEEKYSWQTIGKNLADAWRDL